MSNSANNKLLREIRSALILLGADDTLISIIDDKKAHDADKAELIKKWRSDKVDAIKEEAAALIDRLKKQPTLKAVVKGRGSISTGFPSIGTN